MDADACPVKMEIADAARAFNVHVLMVSSYDHRLEGGEGISIVHVDRSDQSADLYIANHIQGQDIVVTQDYGLAALALAKACSVITFRGKVIGDQDIDFLLDSRHSHAKARKRGHYGKGPRPLTEEDRKSFQHKLTKLLKDLQEIV